MESYNKFCKFESNSSIIVSSTLSGVDYQHNMVENAKVSLKATIVGDEAYALNSFQDATMDVLVDASKSCIDEAFKIVAEKATNKAASTIIECVPVVGNIGSFAMDVTIGAYESEETAKLIDAEIDKVRDGIIFQNYGCCANDVKILIGYDSGIQDITQNFQIHEYVDTKNKIQKVDELAGSIFKEGFEYNGVKYQNENGFTAEVLFNDPEAVLALEKILKDEEKSKYNDIISNK